jgi:hypothetical protein
VVRQGEVERLNFRSAQGPGNVEGEGMAALSEGPDSFLEGGPLAVTGNLDGSARGVVAWGGGERNGCDQ